MFWIQIIVPVLLATIGLAMLYADNRNQRAFIRETLANTRSQIVEISEKQSDKSEVKVRLEEIGQNQKSAYGEFRYRQLIAASSASLLPFLLNFMMLINFSA